MRFSLLFFVVLATGMSTVHSFRVSMVLLETLWRTGNAGKPVAGKAEGLIRHFGKLDTAGKFTPSANGLSTNLNPKQLPGAEKAKIYFNDSENFERAGFKVIKDGKGGSGHVTIALTQAETPTALLERLNKVDGWTGPKSLADALKVYEAENVPKKGSAAVAEKGKGKRSMPPSGRETMMKAMAEKRSEYAMV
ncbi:hypothetical protein D9615_003651 [Tricholomella constricta]|uniref:Uncharacterized protein n=1 Tax=Tricholomella constricta TaxID=117010 RepID=A0A8H5HIP6_9AGAR|nr:hypothetical protein D9615_003651 [Tricholomella constricta]